VFAASKLNLTFSGVDKYPIHRVCFETTEGGYTERSSKVAVVASVTDL
jgi:hypothetical protein